MVVGRVGDELKAREKFELVDWGGANFCGRCALSYLGISAMAEAGG